VAATAIDSGVPKPSTLDLRQRFVMEASAIADIGLRTAAASTMTLMVAPWALSRQASKERQALDFYAALAETGDPLRVFPRPDVRVAVKTQTSAPLPLRRRAGRVELTHFESPFVARYPGLRARYAGHRRSTTAWAQHWRHQDGPRPTLCVIHGFMASPYWFNSGFFSLPWFYRHGYDVLLYTLPFHGRRQDRPSLFSGHGFFANGFAHATEAMFQAVFDFRVFVDYLVSIGVPRIGVTGLSLGGYTTALLAAVEDRLHLAIPNAAVADMGELIRDWFPAGQAMSLVLPKRGLPAEVIGRSLSVHSPLSYRPVLAKDRLFIIGGLGDRLAPPGHSSRLWEHWGRCQLHWYPGNHTLHVNRGAYLRLMGRFMQATGFSS
jgi:hypothetical protein